MHNEDLYCFAYVAVDVVCGIVFQTQYENTTANYSSSDYSKSYIEHLKLKLKHTQTLFPNIRQ